MNSRFTTLSAGMSLILVTLTLLNMVASPTKAFPRSRSPSAVDKTDEYMADVLGFEDGDDDNADDDWEPMGTINNRLGGELGGGFNLEDLVELDKDKIAVASSPLSQLLSKSSAPSSRSRQINKRNICEFHGVCERCAKHTKSHEVYSQCCRNVEGRKWCNDFLNYQMGRK